MAEGTFSKDSFGDVKHGPVRKRPRLDAENDRCSDQTDTIKQDRKSSDPLSDLTKDQRIVLYTLFLCDDYLGVYNDEDVTMGDIDVRKILSELEEKGLMKHCHNVVSCENAKIIQSYRKNCLLSDIDKDFYILVASNRSLLNYEWIYLFPSADTEQFGDIPITWMRLVMEGRAQYFPASPKVLHEGFTDGSLQKFIQEWCKVKKLDPIAWADGIHYKEAVRFLSAHTIIGESEKGFTKLVFDQNEWSILISILISENYAISVNDVWKEKVRTIQCVFPSLRESNRDMRADEADGLIKNLMYNKKLLTMKGNVSSRTVEFVSVEVRHQVIGHFVLNHLKNEEDYGNYLKLSSVDSLLDYGRTWWYDPDEKERCLYLPERMEELLIERLGIDAIRHVMVEWKENKDNTKILNRRRKVSTILKLPLEILFWEYEARIRYAECVKKGTQTIHRARAMIVGCAGAGKSTLLKRLQKRSLDELKKVQSTVGLEVHEDIFEIATESVCLKDLPLNSNKEGKQLLSILDFGGQCAYYACHQVYLSRRAFYLLVLNMAKRFDEKVDPSLCEQEGTMFTDWTYGEYLLFWLKSVHTYCDNDAPVIIVGTHLDQTQRQNSTILYNNVLDYIEHVKYLKSHLARERCFVLGFKSDGSSFEDTLSELEKCMVSIAKQDRWRESIPTDWALTEAVLRDFRGQKTRMTSVSKLEQDCFGQIEEKSRKLGDILKFYHDIGVILHFDESSLDKTVIIDIQWFIDAFKNIITDPNHVSDLVHNKGEWLEFNENGRIQDRLITEMWSSRHFEINTNDQTNLLQYMERLGLIYIGREAHYIPCMNKRTFTIEQEDDMKSIPSQTSVLVFRFPFLPYFIYFRLIVACLTKTNGEWRFPKDKELPLYKNLACFMYKNHTVALAVNRHSIQLQVFQRSSNSILKPVTLEIRDDVESLLRDLTNNFHKTITYTVGYQCSKQDVFHEHSDCFIEKEEIHGKGNQPCPVHEMDNFHTLSESDLLYHWNKDVQDRPTSSKETDLSESDLLKFNMAIGKDIVVIATSLQLSGVEIERSTMENLTSVPNAVHSILLKWKRKHGRAATLENLEKSLREAVRDTDASVDWDVFYRAKGDILKERNELKQ